MLAVSLKSGRLHNKVICGTTAVDLREDLPVLCVLTFNRRLLHWYSTGDCFPFTINLFISAAGLARRCSWVSSFDALFRLVDFWGSADERPSDECCFSAVFPYKIAVRFKLLLFVPDYLQFEGQLVLQRVGVKVSK